MTEAISPFFKTRNFGKALTALVEDDDAGEGGQAAQEAGDLRIFLQKLDMGDEARHEHEVDRTVTDNLVGDVDIAAQMLGGTPADYDLGNERVVAKADASKSITYAQAATKASHAGFGVRSWSSRAAVAAGAELAVLPVTKPVRCAAAPR
mgnify:CR=1 FL=1